MGWGHSRGELGILHPIEYIHLAGIVGSCRSEGYGCSGNGGRWMDGRMVHVVGRVKWGWCMGF